MPPTEDGLGGISCHESWCNESENERQHKKLETIDQKIRQ